VLEREKLFLIKMADTGDSSPVSASNRPTLAMGIPNREDYGDFNKLKAGKLYDYFIQRHHSRGRAGLHHDIRFGNPDLNLYSFATKKNLPEPGKGVALFNTQIHAYPYGSFSGKIGHGYGEGDVKLIRQGKILITHLDKNSIHFSTADGNDIYRFTLVRPKKAGSRQWLAIRSKDPEGTGLEKKHYSLISPDEADEVLSNLQETASVQPKIDGALAYLRLRKDRMDILSHRISKRTGKPIVHTERVFGKNPRFDFPKQYRGAVLLAELYGMRNGRAIPAQQLGGLLNSGIGKSLETQRQQGVELKGMLHGVGRLPGAEDSGNDNDIPYSQQKALLDEIQPYLPGNKFSMPEEVVGGGQQARELLKRIRSGNHPLTREGLVIHPETGSPMKIKPTDEHDVFVREIYPGEGRLANEYAGGFKYSLEPDSEIVGSVGTGIDDETRKDLWKNRAQYVGRAAKIHAQEQFPSGAYRAPVFHSLHEDQ
jgi:hypothetical protein